MSNTKGTVKYSANFNLGTAAPFGAGPTSNATPVDESWGPGTDSQQIDSPTVLSFNIEGGGTRTVNLQTALRGDNQALALVEVRHLSLQADKTNVDSITVEPHGTDGWTAWIRTGSVMDAQPGATIPLIAPEDGGYPVLVDNRQLLLTNTDATIAGKITVAIAGVTS